MFRRISGLVILAFLAFMLLAAQPVEARGHPHFEADATFALVNADGTVSVTFQEAGLGHVVTPILYRVVAMPGGTITCLDAAGLPLATTPFFSGPLVATVSGAHNGQNTLTVVLPALAPGLFACPFGTVTASVAAGPIVITDLTNGVSFVLPGPFVLPVPPGLPPVLPAFE